MHEIAERLRVRGPSREIVRVPQSTYKWSEKEADRRGRRSSGNLTYDASIKNVASDANTPLEAFCALFSDNILENIMNRTNEQITREVTLLMAEGNRNQSYYREIYKIELEAYIGVCFYYALFKENKLCLDDMRSEVFDRGIYRATMSQKRFQFLTRVTRFDDEDTRVERRAADKLAPIREIWKIFIQHCVDNYEPSTQYTIDEQLDSFKGSCIFRICMKNKPDEYGMKILMLHDAKTCYMIAAIPYVGKVTPAENDDVPAYFVKSLINMAFISGSW